MSSPRTMVQRIPSLPAEQDDHFYGYGVMGYRSPPGTCSPCGRCTRRSARSTSRSGTAAQTEHGRCGPTSTVTVVPALLGQRPAGRGRRHPARRARGRHRRRGGLGKSSLIDGSLAGREGVVVVDQAPIRGSRRSNPATYTKLQDPIRTAFARRTTIKRAVQRHSDGARPNCNGAGVIHTDLGVMAGVATPCEECDGKRFQASVLDTSSAAATSARCRRCRSPRRGGSSRPHGGEIRPPTRSSAGSRDVGLGYLHRPAVSHDALRRRAPAAEPRHTNV